MKRLFLKNILGCVNSFLGKKINKMHLIFVMTLAFFFTNALVKAQNPNLFVSAENSQFDNYMSGPQVIEVVIIDPAIAAIDEAQGEPDVTVNGQILRMVQAIDGSWYGYFADSDMAEIADSTTAVDGAGLDFGTICYGISDLEVAESFISNDLNNPLDLGDLAGVAIGAMDCFGSGFDLGIPNVLREAKEPSAQNFSFVEPGQIGVNTDAWPFIQLYELTPGGNVVIQYHKAGDVQTTTLTFNTVDQFASIELDREVYGPSSEVHATITDPWLNIDPTDEDSWTFATNASSSDAGTYYQVFDENGNLAGDAVPDGVIHLDADTLGDLMCDGNCILFADTNAQNAENDVLTLQDNSDSEIEDTVGNGLAVDFSTFGGSLLGGVPVTFTEQGPNSGVFRATDEGNVSNLIITQNAERGRSATLDYNDNPQSVLVGFVTASIDILPIDNEWDSGEEIMVVLKDGDLDRNANVAEDLDLFNPDVDHVPALQTGSPITLEDLGDAHLGGTDVFPPDTYPEFIEAISQRAFIEANSEITIIDGDELTLVLDSTFGDLYDSIHQDGKENFRGISLINYDIRSIFINADIDSVAVSISDGINTVAIATNAGAQELINLEDSAGPDFFILDESSNVELIFEFDAFGTTIPQGTVMPIVADFFSFGFFNDGLFASERVANMIVRLELEETGGNTGEFQGSLEYTMLNQLKILDPATYEGLNPISDRATFIINQPLTGENAPSINYLDVGDDGGFRRIFDRENAGSFSGEVSFERDVYRPDDTVVITLHDRDLNADNQLQDIYTVVNAALVDSASGTVGEEGLPELSFGPLGRLLEISFDDQPWISGFDCDREIFDNEGLFFTGFSLVETENDSGVFRGSFPAPAVFCNSSTGDGEVESTVGTKITAKYTDFRDSSGSIREVMASADIKSFEPSAPRVQIKEPIDLLEITGPTDIEVIIEAEDDDGEILSVNLFQQICTVVEDQEECTEKISINGVIRDPAIPDLWKVTWENVAVDSQYKLTAIAEDNSRTTTESDPVRISVVPFQIGFTSPGANEEDINKGEEFRFSWNISPGVPNFSFSLYLFERPTLTLAQIENEQAVLVSSNLDSTNNISGFTDTAGNRVRDGATQTTWYPHIRVTSGTFPDNIQSGENSFTVVDNPLGVRKDVTITLTTRPKDEILYGESISVEAVVVDENNDPFPGTNSVIVQFIDPNEEAQDISTRVTEGQIIFERNFVPNLVGNWKFQIIWPGNSLFNPGQSESINVEVIPSKATIELFGLGAPHFNGKPIRVVGRLSLLNGNPGDVSLSAIPVNFTITDPDGMKFEPTTEDLNVLFPNSETPDEILTSANGIFEVIIDNQQRFFNRVGDWSIQAYTQGNDNLELDEDGRVSSTRVDIPVREKQGYAILCQGSVPGGEGVIEHRNTLEFARNVLISDGQILNDDTNTQNDDIFEILADDPNPKSRLREAITVWASNKMQDNPAPLYIVLINHGEPDEFHMDSQSAFVDDAILTASQLNRMLVNLQTFPDNPSARDENIILILGMCFSGSFIDELSADGRIIVSASAPNERSIRGPGEGEIDPTRQGEYFVYLLFRELSSGASLLDSFVSSNRIIRLTSSNFKLATNSILFNGEDGQHPLLDDDGDGMGSQNVSSTLGDGQQAAKVILKVADNAFGILEVARTNPTIFLTENDGIIPTLFAEVDEKPSDQIVFPISMKVKQREGESFDPGGVASMQANLNLICQPMKFDTLVTDRVRYLWPASNISETDETIFDNPGVYEVFFFARNNVNSSPSEPGISLVYRAPIGSTRLDSVALISPANTEPPPLVDFIADPDNEDRTGLFKWNPIPGGNESIQYIFRLWLDEGRDQLTLQSSPLDLPEFTLSPNQVVNRNYWWDVIAVDDSGNFSDPDNSELRQIVVNKTNDLSSRPVAARLFNPQNNDEFVPGELEFVGPISFLANVENGIFSRRLEKGIYTITAKANGYLDLEKRVPVEVLTESDSRTTLQIDFPMRKPEQTLVVESQPEIGLEIREVRGAFSGTTPYEVSSPAGKSQVVLVAPRVKKIEGIQYHFTHWEIAGKRQQIGQFRVDFDFDNNTTAVAFYESGDVRLEVRSLPFNEVSLATTFDGIPLFENDESRTNFITTLLSGSEITLTAPEEFENSNFKEWIIREFDGDGSDFGINPEGEREFDLTLTQTITKNTEIIAVYEVQWTIEPDWNLLSTPVRLERDNSVFTKLKTISRSPLWQWREGRFRIVEELEAGSSFWLNSDRPQILKPEGITADGSSDIEIKSGWNLIAVKGHRVMEKEEVTDEDTTLWTWDCPNQRYITTEDDSLQPFQKGRLFPGQGFWFFEKEE